MQQGSAVLGGELREMQVSGRVLDRKLDQRSAGVDTDGHLCVRDVVLTQRLVLD